MNSWIVTENIWKTDQKHIHSQETVFTIGNGYFGTRGSFEEGYPHANPATLLFGVFDDIPIAKEELANAPDWTVIQLFVNGERFRLDRGTLHSYERHLDLRTGVLSRHIQWESPTGIRLHISIERFASLADEHAAVIRYSVHADDHNTQDAEIELRANINAAQGNYNVMHWETADQNSTDDIVWLLSETKKSQVFLAQSISFQANHPAFEKKIVNSDLEPSIRLYGNLNPGANVVSEKITVMYTSRDNVGNPVQAALNHHQSLLAQDDSALYEKLFAQNAQAWKQYWDVADVIIEGDDKAQLGLRYNLYQLRINVRPNDSRYSIAAKGLTGFGYRGHVFHDTEIFMLPFYIYVFPEIARNLLLYRYHLLPAARKKAMSNGFEGAQFPWESTLDGEETTPISMIHPETGEFIPILNGFIELHISSSIAYAAWNYWRVTGDDDFMRDYGAELILSTATFWGSRAEWDAKHKEYVINDVIGPDEWHEHVNNNTFTNYMARLNLQNALAILDWLKTSAPAKARSLINELDLNDQRLQLWQDVTEGLRILQDKKTGLIEQFEGFFKLPFLDQDKYQGRKDSYQGLLGMHEVQKYQIVKQADVLMLLTVAERDFDLKTKQVNWDYYYPITDHDYGSSLTPAFHVILASQLGHVEVAYNLFMKGALVDLENLRGNTPEGIHAACAGAVWQAAILGCAGLQLTEDGFTTNPAWPANWTRLAFHFYHKGKLEYVDLRR